VALDLNMLVDKNPPEELVLLMTAWAQCFFDTGF
jgi:hypothetical protein